MAKMMTALLAMVVAFASSAAWAADDKAIEPEARALLESMRKRLRAVETFRLEAQTSVDQTVDKDMKIQRIANVDIAAVGNTKLRSTVAGDRNNGTIIYDGKTVTVSGAKTGYYASAPAPETTGKMLDEVKTRFDLEFPLIDVLRLAKGDKEFEGITALAIVGSAVIDGKKCQQLAVRQANVDWQVWIDENDLPRRLVITTKNEPGEPQFSANMRWDVSPKLTDKTFSFSPEPGAVKVPLLDLAPAPKSGMQKEATP